MSDKNEFKKYLTLAKVQAEIGNVTKDKKANYGKYVTLDAINEASGPCLAKYNAALIDRIIEHEDTLSLETSFVCEDGVISVCCPFPYKDALRGNNEMQKIGSGMTYARRYNRHCLLNLATEDDDGNKMNNVKPDKTTHSYAKAKPKGPAFKTKPVEIPRVDVVEFKGGSPYDFVIPKGMFKDKTIKEVEYETLKDNLQKAYMFNTKENLDVEWIKKANAINETREKK